MAVFVFKVALWGVVALSVIGMTVVPFSLFLEMLMARRKARKAQR
ncbi:hypothetical protein [Pararhizobium sp.]